MIGSWRDGDSLTTAAANHEVVNDGLGVRTDDG
jgi:hypothetical protein